MKRGKEVPEKDLGFQLAPMIDVVFVIMLFFMVMAGAVKVEYEIKTTLPGTVENTESTDQPEEVNIGVSEAGEITLNQDPIGRPGDKELKDLYIEMKKLADAATQAKMKIVVTVAAEETAKYDRIMNVLDVLAKAKVSNVTFSATSGDEF